MSTQVSGESTPAAPEDLSLTARNIAQMVRSGAMRLSQLKELKYHAPDGQKIGRITRIEVGIKIQIVTATINGRLPIGSERVIEIPLDAKVSRLSRRPLPDQPDNITFIWAQHKSERRVEHVLTLLVG